MIAIKLHESKNAIVRAHLDAYDNGAGVQTRAEMLNVLCQELLEELTKCEEQLALDQTKSKVGAFVLHVPIQYMTENAKPKEVTVYNILKEQLVKITKGESEGMILPALTDENGNRMFTLSYVGPDI